MGYVFDFLSPSFTLSLWSFMLMRSTYRSLEENNSNISFSGRRLGRAMMRRISLL